MSNAIDASNMSNAVLSAQYQARVIGLQKDAIDMAGQQAVKLIQSASVLPPGQGIKLDVLA